MQAIGNTPLDRINKLMKGLNAQVVAKLEKAKPLASVKDPIGIATIEVTERGGNHQS
jgi:cysteine synthase